MDNWRKIMPRYEVTVEVVYHITADNEFEASETINKGAEYPVVPYDDETYCSTVTLKSVEVL
jgi:hypothetical protein